MSRFEVTELRFKIKSASSQQVLPGQDGILAIVIAEYANSDKVGVPVKSLVTMVDMQDRNKGCSLTNGIETAITYIAQQVGIHHPLTRWIEMDSEGYFDELSLRLDDSGQECVGVGWVPLKHGNHVRTIDAYHESFGELAEQSFEALGIEIPSQKLRLSA